jgi:anti-sigma B factor antagonist
MGNPGSEQSSVDAHGIRPPSAYAVEPREAPSGVVLLALEGEFDLAAAPVLRERLETAGTGGARAVVLDMSEVTFVDSSALRVLLRADAVLREHGVRLTLAALQPAVARLLELTRTTDALTLAPTVAQALERPSRP